jgi:integrase
MKGKVERYTLADGSPRWSIRWDLPPGADGKRRQAKRRGFTRERDADRALRAAIGDVEQGRGVAHTRVSVAEYLNAWLDGIDRRATTLDNYRRCAKRAIEGHCRECALGGRRLQDLQPEHLDRLYRHLEREGRRGPKGARLPMKPKTVRHHHTLLHAALADAVRRGHVSRNVAALANPPTAKASASKAAKSEKVWTADELRGFLAHVAADRLCAAWMLFATTGMRRSEVAGLRWRDVDLDEGTVTVAQTATVVAGKVVWAEVAKTEAGERSFSLDPLTLAALRDRRKAQLAERLLVGPGWVEDPHGTLVFTWPDGRAISPDRFLTHLRRHAKAAGLPATDVHALRHAYATAALRAGVSPEVLAARIGHEDVATTLRTYAHVRREDDRDAAERAATAILGG